VGFDDTDRLQKIYFAFVSYWKKWEYNERVHQLFMDFKKAYDSVRREVLFNIHIEFWVPMKLVRLNKMCLNETHSKVRIDKRLSDMLYFSILLQLVLEFIFGFVYRPPCNNVKI
jgi:hypothetical protein